MPASCFAIQWCSEGCWESKFKPARTWKPLCGICLQALLRYQHVWPIEVVLRPFALGEIMRSSGNRPPGVLPARAMYMLKDLQRNNEFWGMKLSPPKDFMKWVRTESSANAMKLLVAVQNEQPGMLETVSREFWKRIWMQGERIFDREDFEKVLAASGITNIAHYLEKMNEDSIGVDLAKNTSEALDTGAFGAPWIVVHKNGEEHAFFGSDRLHLIAHLIGEKFIDGLQQYAKL